MRSIHSEIETESMTGDWEEFVRLADRLDMPLTERRNILDLSDAQWLDLQRGLPPRALRHEQQRRMKYALSLMRRASDNQGQ